MNVSTVDSTFTLFFFSEVKRSMNLPSREFGKFIRELQCGKDVTETCFDECLEIAVDKNLHFTAGFIIIQSPTNIIHCLHKALSKPETLDVAAMLVMCVAAEEGDTRMLEILCRSDDIRMRETKDVSVIRRDYLPYKNMSQDELNALR